ncbi:MAG TPA: glutamyl-tRNA reductase [Ktedonobacterales bacterium]|jgi:glutamyl-tRNA reductase|nr:glutamyl-tRNA reductase [Ktedonobacterales bacterium]
MIGLLGIDHQHAHADVRGRLSFASESLLEALRGLRAADGIDEVAVLSTCNRTEVYFATGDIATAGASARAFLEAAYEAARHVQAPSFGVHGAARWETNVRKVGSAPTTAALPLYELQDRDAALHLFRVASGLESIAVGESQILGQVKEALAAAESVHCVNEELRSLFTHAIKAGKRVRAETEIGRANVSVAALAVRVARESLGQLAGKSALIIGAGRTSRLCAQLLRSEGLARLVLANRSAQSAADLADEVGGETLALHEIPRVLPDVQLIISATAAPHVVLDAATVAHGLGKRHTPLIVIDLAVPADVEEAVGLLPPVSLYTLDSLQAFAGRAPRETDERPDGRSPELTQAEAVLDDCLAAFTRDQMVRRMVPGIAGLRRHVDRSEEAERTRTLAQLEHLSEAERQIVSRFGQRLVDKMFFHLVSRIRSLAEYDEVPPEVTMRVLLRLFDDPDAPSPDA